LLYLAGGTKDLVGVWQFRVQQLLELAALHFLVLYLKKKSLVDFYFLKKKNTI